MVRGRPGGISLFSSRGKYLKLCICSSDDISKQIPIFYLKCFFFQLSWRKISPLSTDYIAWNLLCKLQPVLILTSWCEISVPVSLGPRHASTIRFRLSTCFSPGGKSACYASVNSEYTYCNFLKTPGFTALPYAKVCDFCVIFDWVSSANFGANTTPPHPPVEMPLVRHW